MTGPKHITSKLSPDAGEYNLGTIVANVGQALGERGQSAFDSLESVIDPLNSVGAEAGMLWRPGEPVGGYAEIGRDFETETSAFGTSVNVEAEVDVGARANFDGIVDPYVQLGIEAFSDTMDSGLGETTASGVVLGEAGLRHHFIEAGAAIVTRSTDPEAFLQEIRGAAVAGHDDMGAYGCVQGNIEHKIPGMEKLRGVYNAYGCATSQGSGAGASAGIKREDIIGNLDVEAGATFNAGEHRGGVGPGGLALSGDDSGATAYVKAGFDF